MEKHLVGSELEVVGAEVTGDAPVAPDERPHDGGAAGRVLHDVFGFSSFRGAQQAIVDRVVTGHDTVVLMPTGGGKSLCYQLPALVRPGVGIVVSPLIALMHDQVEALRLLGVRAAFWNSTSSAEESDAVRRDVREGGLDLLYVAPERLLMPSFLRLLDDAATGAGIALFAIDEAHCVSQWGHDFRPEYLRIAEVTARFPGVPRIALTATADALTRSEIHQRLRLDGAAEFVSSFDRPNIRYVVEEKSDARAQLLRFLESGNDGASFRGSAGIVYCQSRKRTDEISAFLRQQGYDAIAYHAGLPSEARAAAQQRFRRDEGVIVVATIAFGMGIDKPDVRFVAHVDLPKSLEGYYQETGRAGRDGEPAVAWMAYGLADAVQQRSFITRSDGSAEHQRVDSMKLDAMLGYAEASTCRRRLLLAYFDEDSGDCGNCDTCMEPPQMWDATVPAQKVLSAVIRTGQRFGAGHVIDVLLGKRTDKIASWGHDQLPTFGVGSDLADREWRSVIRQLVARSVLVPDPSRMGALTITEAARPILDGAEKVELRRLSAAPARSRSASGSRSAGSGSGAATGAGASPADRALFELLRTERRTIADAEGVPAYVVLPDRTLWELVRARPGSTAALLTVNGIGPVKAEKYGAAFLALLAEHTG
ncbi:DNA helicase RecQ [Terrabacter sp. LjRoot27]|uniref:DNA helicase RecQ n=1 Tax=Terrabacter sp. LjRoot27 TaxID=3342306 RepID=UPI003ED1011A